MELSVVVPAYNAAATLREQLDALLAQEWSGSWEVVVVDNGSSDSTPVITREYAARDARIRLVEANDRRRIGYARNAGVAAAQGRAIAMCDSDDVVQPGWLAAIGNALRDHEFVGGALDVHLLNRPEIVATRGLAIEREAASFQGIFAVAHSCNMAFTRALFERVGPFDETLVNGSDVELSHRIWLDGTVMHYEPDARVAYRYRSSGRDLFRQARNYGRINALLVAKFRAAGTDVSLAPELRGWIWLVRKVPLLFTGEGRPRWLWSAGTRAGRLEGRVRHRKALRDARA
ncbi:MAG TPA: glycosyltransferase [Acidimicrobiia bacterium]